MTPKRRLHEFALRPQHHLWLICHGQRSFVQTFLRPHHPTQIAVGLASFYFVPKSSGVVMFADGVRLPKAASLAYGFDPYSVAGYADADTAYFTDEFGMLAKANYVDPGQVHRYVVSNEGIEVAQVYRQVATGATSIQIRNGLMFGNDAGVYSFGSDVKVQSLRHCQYAIPDSDGTHLLCFAPNSQSHEIQFDVRLYGLNGERLERWGKLDLSPYISVPGLATPSADVVHASVNSAGQVALLVYYPVTNVHGIFFFSISDLSAKSAPPVLLGHDEINGVRADWVNIPLQKIAFNSSLNAIVGTSDPNYGPDGSKLFVIDAKTRQIIRKVSLRREALGMTLSTDGRFAYVWDTAGIQQIDITTGVMGWSFDGCCFQTVTARPGAQDQIAVADWNNVWLIDKGKVISSIRSDMNQTTTLAFASVDSLVQLTYQSAKYFTISNNTLSSGSTVSASIDGASVHDVLISGQYAYSRAGQMFDLVAAKDYSEKPKVIPDSEPNIGYALVSAFVPQTPSTFLTMRYPYEASSTRLVEYWNANSSTPLQAFLVQHDLAYPNDEIMDMRALGDFTSVFGLVDQLTGSGATVIMNWDH